MLGYRVLGSCACDWVATHSTMASATIHNAYLRPSFRVTASFLVIDMMSSPSYETSPLTAFTFRGFLPSLACAPLNHSTFSKLQPRGWRVPHPHYCGNNLQIGLNLKLAEVMVEMLIHQCRPFDGG